GTLYALQRVSYLRFDALFDLRLLEPEALFRNHGLRVVGFRSPVTEVQVDLNSRLNGRVTPPEYIRESRAIAADQEARRRAEGRRGKWRQAGEIGKRIYAIRE